MKPFSLFLHKFNQDILELEYPHLLITNLERKKLTLYPGIIIKCKDIGYHESKTRFQLLLGPSKLIKGSQLDTLSVSKALVFDYDDKELKDYEKLHLAE